MHPYNKSQVWTKGLAGNRRSKDTVHRRRCLRVNKKAARQDAKVDCRFEDLDFLWKHGL